MTGLRPRRSALEARKRPSEDEIERRYRQALSRPALVNGIVSMLLGFGAALLGRTIGVAL